VFIRGIRAAMKLAKSEPLASTLVGDDAHPDLDHKLDLLSDKEIETVVRERVETVYVPAQSCSYFSFRELIFVGDGVDITQSARR
jgi:choline dehydrogenase